MTQSTQASPPPMSRDEIIGFHKGSLNTLAAERGELLRLVQITEGLMHAHMQELEKLGVHIPTAPAHDHTQQHSQNHNNQQSRSPPPRKR